MNLPNRITLSRIALVVVFVLLALSDLPYAEAWAALIFMIASFTDSLDGYLARSRNMVTTLGKFLDPLADKILVCAGLIILVDLGRIAAWVVIVIIFREFAVNGLRILAADRGIVIAASIWGKIKTATQMVTIVLLLLEGLSFWPQPGYHILGQVLVYLMLAATVLSGADYLWKGRGILNEDPT